MDQLTEMFTARGLKVTPQRQVLFQIMIGNDSHPSAEAVHAAAARVMPGISLRTVYHTLTDLVAMGEVNVLSVGSGPTRFDPNTDAHHHTVCRDCGAVHDVYLGDVTHLADDVAGFFADDVGVVINGRCQHCQSQQTSTREKP